MDGQSTESRLARLQRTLGAMAEKAYTQRDSMDEDVEAQAYAAGMGHAYGVAEGEVLRAQREPPTQA